MAFKLFLERSDNMKLYVVQGNVYMESYGDYRNIFGVYDDKNLANNRVEEMKAELYSEEMKKKHVNVNVIKQL